LLLRLELTCDVGFEKFRNVTSSYYRGAHGILLVFDLTAPATFNNLRGWHSDCQKFTSECSFVLVGNKSDEKAEVSESEGNPFPSQSRDHLILAAAVALCNELKIKEYITTSAKEGTNVEKAFTTLATMVLSNQI
jgi:Ras-related protein Rab-1A